MSSKRSGRPPEGPNRGTPGPNAPANPTPVAKPPAARRSGKPAQLCRFFKRGSCKYTTGCRYSHAVAEAEGIVSGGPPPERHPTRNNRASTTNFPGVSNDHFSPVVLNQSSGSTFNSLQKFVADSFKFQTPDQVYLFLNLVCTASSQNSATWTAKDAQTHLHKLVQGNGIQRLADAIRFPKETTRAWSFQRGYIPIFTYLSSEWVVKSTLHGDVNALYGLIHREFRTIRDVVETNMNKFMVARSFKENSSPLQLSGKQVFKVMFVAIFEYLTRFKEANITNPGICDFTEQIAEWFDQWVEALGSNPPFQDECTTYDTENLAFFIENLRRDKERVLRLVRRGQTVVVVNNEAQEAFEPPKDASPGLLAALERAFEYDGPGDLCEAGRPRHDNDYAEIDMIQVVPTRDELLCEADPYLPGNFFEAPHYYDPRSADRLLDIQFRLLREELMSQIRLAVQHIVDDLKQSRSGTRVLLQKLNPRSGIYATTGRDSVRFSVFTGVTFQSLELAKRGISVGLEFDTPPGKAKSNNPASRGGYWDQLTKKRLSQDALVALIWKTPAGKVDIYLGTVASSGRDLVNCARKNGGQNRLSISVSFFVAKANVRIVQALQNHRSNNDTCVLMEAPVFYEGIRPFLEGLKREPELLPFARYLRLQSRDELRQINIDPPLYSRTPGFSFELKHLFPPEANVESLRLNTGNLESIANVRARLQASRLDPSQAEAVVDSLTREVALIQGPPGTGKSYTGLELIRVLIKNNICPILLVAFTNHALDHMLNGILNAGITQNVIRLGSRFAANERLQPYLLETLGRQAGKSRLSASRKSATDQMKDLESQMKGLMDKISSHKVPSSHIEEHISYMYPHHYGELFRHTPSWIDAITPKPSETEEGWEIAGEPPNEEYSIIKFWRKGRDLDFLETQGQNGAAPETSAQVSSFNQFEVLLDSKSSDEPETTTHQNFLRDFMREHGFKNVPKVPKTNRPVNLLQKNPGVWRMSRSERISLHKIWSIEAGDVTHESQIREFEKFRLAHKVASEQHKEISDQLKAEILSRSHIVGCTTTAAAKYTSLLSGMSPKVMIVEEAGQVLESHILAGLVKSLEHVILIGDPLQLRPNINCYGLATENADSGYIYKFDQSLMERLSSGGFPMSQIDVQRRMRPEISSLIRNTLYPKLQDNEQVQSYPNVRGMYKNMFFVSHTHKEAGGGDASVSKHNSFEVDMIYDLVLHLLKQGCYNKSGNIVVLTAYLGQIPKIRQKLQDIVTIVIDERDAELLDPHTIETEETSAVQQVELNKQVIIRTLDNFQGEEGEVIILSLVRNSGTALDEEMPSLEHIGKGPIGFLKNKNRTNVGLSRAKHGLYVFGNAPELAQGSKMWSDVLKEFHSTQCLGTKFPISCHRHPEYVKWIGNPGELAIASPNGGCCRPCAQALSCGHICPSLCHADDPNHISTKCKQPCTRLCPLMHPCDRECWECSTDSTNCRFPIVDLQLPCGHIHPPTQCHVINVPEKIKCPIEVIKQLPTCSHNATMLCHQDPSSYACPEQTLKELPQCQHHATIPCSKDPRAHSCQKQVEKTLDCGHRIRMLCSQDPAGIKCPQPVERTLACTHQLTVPCHQDMSSYICQLEVEKQLPNCSHHATMPCHQNPITFVCQERVTTSLPNCNHRTQIPCHQNTSDYVCLEPMEIRFASCGHHKQLTCHRFQDPASKLCQERVDRTMPACKHQITMPCHKDPTRQKCQTRVEKELPFCEHRVLVPCHQDPATYFCSRPCGGALLCCSGTCSAKCGACHKLNPGEIIFGVRTKHTKHKCNRGMACGHPCNLPCREGHACSKICKGKCQQSCSHSNCRQKCSTVCKPCGESCVWKCVHMKCTSPCGMACTRLPCDEKCSETLSCGHPCPSVCGEPCDYQTCKTCNEDNLDSVVDLLKQTSLHDRKGNDALGSMTITLPCRHVLTVKALDDITRINAFYYRDAHGRWASPAMPPSTSNVRDRPVCPHCGGEIDSLRYGRVLKFSNHSILQNNIARNLSKRLSQAESMLSEVRSGIEATITTAVGSFGTANISVPSDTLRRSLIQRTDVAVAAEKGHPTSLDLVENLSKFHGFPPVHTKAWRKAVSEVMEPYRVAYDVTRETDPSARGYEKSLAQLYEEALRKSGGRTGPTTDPAQLRLQQDAADSAYTRIGHLPPRASKRFVVEAFWISIEILMVLGLTISRARETVQDQNERRANAICWDNVAKFFLLRASKDAETALAIAEESKSQSKVVRCQLLVLQTQYEHAAHQCRVAIRTRLLSNREVRGDYMDICARGIEKVQILQASVPRNYQGRVQRGSVIDMTTAKAEWVRKRFTRPTEKILEAWFNLNRLIQGRLQEDASAQRLISWKPIVQEAAASRRTWHAEYFYLCSRGHPYTRRECTVTLGKMCCPECGRIVGDQK